MPALFTFLFKVNIALVLFCLGYYAVLRHLTFYTLNRIYLVVAILFASVYPLININSFIQSHQQFTAPVQYVIMEWKAPAANLVKPLDQPNYWQWAGIAFWTGVALLAIRLVLQLFSLYRLHKASQPGRLANFPVRLVNGDVSPFSFWRSIYVNPDKLSASDLGKVLEHEHIHVNEWHTADILLAELSTIFYWFNPGIWLIKKAIRENIEFITDRKILQKGTDSKQYQYSLLSVSMAGTPNKLVNNFNISTIKKRIIMMNAKRSSRINLTRYMFVAPAVVILLLAFSISKAAIAKKGLNTIKSITSAIKGVTIPGDDRPIVHPASASSNRSVGYAITTIAKGRSNDADTIYYGKSKDGKRNMLVTSSKGRDSVVYVINGEKTGRNDVLNLDPAKIYSIDMISASIAKEFVDFTLDKPEVLFVTTDDSEAGRKLKARIDKSMRYGVLAAANRAKSLSTGNGLDIAPGASSSPSSVAYSIATTSSSNDVAPAAGSNIAVATTVSSDTAPEVAAVDAKGRTIIGAKNHIYITTSPKMAVSTNGVVTIDGKVLTTPNSDVLTIVDSNGVVHKDYLYTNKSRVYRSKKGNGEGSYVFLTDKGNNETTIDNFNNGVLYVIDGKEAKSLKGISAEDIRSITALRDEAAKKKYGDKGKNGVIVVTTKKGSK